MYSLISASCFTFINELELIFSQQLKFIFFDNVYIYIYIIWYYVDLPLKILF